MLIASGVLSGRAAKGVGCAFVLNGRTRETGRSRGRSWARRGSARAGLDNAGGPRSARWLSDSVGESHRVLHRVDPSFSLN